MVLRLSIFMLVSVLPSCETLAQEESLKIRDAVGEIISKMDNSVVTNQSGSMAFELTEFLKDRRIVYSGNINWRYPDIRWDFSETQFMESKATPSNNKILIDNSSEIIAINLTSRQAYRSIDKSKKYQTCLRFAPWQRWMSLDDQIPWKQVLDVDEILRTNRSIRSQTSGASSVFVLGTNDNLGRNGVAAAGFVLLTRLSDSAFLLPG